MAVHEEILALARSRPADALKRIADFLDLEETTGIELGRILQAGGLAARLTGDLDLSNRYLARAIELATEAGDEAGRIRANITRAGNSLLAGDPNRAIERLKALGTPDEPELAARLGLQLGTIYARTAHFDEAVDQFTRALAAAEQAGDRRLVAVTTKNRGMLRTYSGFYTDARRDFQAARDTFQDLGLEIEVAYCDHNLGLIADYSGDLQGALSLFASAEAQIADLAGSQWEVQASRCDALLHAGLATEAAELAEQIAGQMLQADHELDRSEALITWAKAEMLRGDFARADDVAAMAVESCAQQGRADWQAHAHLVQVRARAQLGEPTDVADIEALATTLETNHHALASLEADLAVVEEVSRTDSHDALNRLSGMRTRLRLAPVAIRLAAHSLSARARITIGDLRGADAAARSAFKLLYEYQGVLGSGDVRVAVRSHSRDSGSAGLTLALRAHKPRRVFDWLERDKWATLYGVAPLAQHDAAVRRRTAKYRALVRSFEVDDYDSLDLRLRAESELREAIRAHRGSGTAVKPLRAREVIAQSTGTTVLAIGEHEGRLIAVKLHRGRASQHDLGDAVLARNRTRATRATLRRQLTGATSAAVGDGFADLSAQLLEPVGVLGERVVVLPPPFLFGAPWRALPGLQSKFVSVSPSATLWQRRRGLPTRAELLLVAGPGLQEGDREVRMLDAVTSKSTVLRGSAATVDNVIGGLARSGIAHIAAHGENRTDNPMFSSLEMTDGPLTVYDIGRISSPPHTVVLSACHVGLAADKPGRELLGLVGGLLQAGSRSIVASTLPLPDTDSTVRYMIAFHRALSAGETPTVALQAADDTLSSDTQRLFYQSAITLFGGD